MARLFLLILDSFGIGGAPDAADYGDTGANTLTHIAEQRPLSLPFMGKLGLAHASYLATGLTPRGFSDYHEPSGIFGAANEISKGKDTPSGHWEIAGQPVMFEWGYFPRKVPSFPETLIDAVCLYLGVDQVLGNCHASGTDIIARCGEDHLKTGLPIFYTSTDSVIQIAAHETEFGLDRLYALCKFVRQELDKPNIARDRKIGRVIARPFIGAKKTDFIRTGNRRDYSVLPPQPTLLNIAKGAGREVIAIGKISDIYAHQGVTDVCKASGNMALFDATLNAAQAANGGSLIITNFVDFDMLYGHRRDVEGYAKALEDFDARLPELDSILRPDDLVLITADHGCDPTWPGTDHTRERVPILGFGPKIGRKDIGIRSTFADIGASAARYLGLPDTDYGESFL